MKHFHNLKKSVSRLFVLLFAATFLIMLTSCSPKASKNNLIQTTQSLQDIQPSQNLQNSQSTTISEDGTYTSKDDVALYIYTYKKLPKNFITKKEAKALGWNNTKNYVGDVAKGKSLGGSIYKNYEKLLPDIEGRTYYECDIDYKGKKRTAKRIVYADDFDEKIGFIYYTGDHYKTFERIY